MKKIISILLLLALVSVFACSAGAETVAISGDKIDIGDLALRPDGVAGKLYENGGLKLLIPLELDELLIIEMPEKDENGVLFSVSEKASVEAAKGRGSNYDGAGWLFAIRRIDEKTMQDLLCHTDLSGTELFAVDADGNYYVYAHPTDVRFERETVEQMYSDQEQWTMLNEWAWNDVRKSFLTENEGLTEKNQGSTELDLALAQIAYLPGVRYTLSTTEYGPLEPENGTFDAAPYLQKLRNGVTYRIADEEEAPDGEYAVLAMPEENIRFDFFLMEGKENIIREVWGEDGSFEQLYQAEFKDGMTKASDVVLAWVHAIASQQEVIQ